MLVSANGAACLRSKVEQEVFCKVMTSLTQAAVKGAGGAAKGFHFGKVDPSPQIDFDSEEDWGSFQHWSVLGCRKWANGVIPLLGKLMDWEVVEEASPKQPSGRP